MFHTPQQLRNLYYFIINTTTTNNNTYCLTVVLHLQAIWAPLITKVKNPRKHQNTQTILSLQVSPDNGRYSVQMSKVYYTVMLKTVWLAPCPTCYTFPSCCQRTREWQLLDFTVHKKCIEAGLPWTNWETLMKMFPTMSTCTGEANVSSVHLATGLTDRHL